MTGASIDGSAFVEMPIIPLYGNTDAERAAAARACARYATSRDDHAFLLDVLDLA